ncbi:MAG: Panacea domain-containing protein [bacterium]
MRLRYRQERATQAAARLLQLRGGTMAYMKLLKLLYLADRKALLEHGRPITYDRYVSMDQGPVLSQTYNLIVAEETPDRPTYWRRYISEPEHYEVRLIGEAPTGELSKAQEAILDEVFREFGHLGRWALVDLCHTLPEWVDPQGSSIPISIGDVLRGAGLEADAVAAIEEAFLAEDALASLLD